MYKLLLGIEHLMTGVQLRSLDNDGGTFAFYRQSASIVRVESHEPFAAYWPVKQAFIEAEFVDTYRTCPGQPVPVPAVYSTGEAEWYAQVMGEAMRNADSKVEIFL